MIAGGFLFTGCNRGGTGGGASTAAGSTAAGASAGVDMGAIAYDILHHKYEVAGEAGKMAALEGRRDDFVGAVNRILPSSISNNLFPTLIDLLPLVDEGYVDGAVADVDKLLEELINDQSTLEALAKLLGGQGGVHKAGAGHGRAQLISRLLNYPELEDLVRSGLNLIRANDGLDDAGSPNGERNLLRELLAAASRLMKDYKPASGQNTTNAVASTLDHLSSALLADQDMPAFSNLGAPAWAVRIDAFGNPQVRPDAATGKLPAPFVDADGDQVADVNVDHQPIDQSGAVISIAPFGEDGTRDSYGRALAPGGGLYFDYYDAKRTLLSEVLLLVGELVEKDSLGKAVRFLDRLGSRVQHDNGTPSPDDDWETLSPDCALLDVTHAQFQLVKATPLPQLLQGIAEIVKQDKDKFCDMVDKLIAAIANAHAAASNTPAPGSASGLVSDLLPLLEDTLRPQGRSTSSLRALLQAFNSEQRKLRTLPVTFARMMKFHDYKNRIPADASKKSVMQRILEMMEGANQCSAPFMGNMAEFYLEAMAGNQRILGITIHIGTIHRLLDVGFLRNLLCSNIKADDVRALKDFNDSGALDAMKPIAKVFSDRGETTLLKDIMLGLGKHYDPVMRPTEPTAVAVLESGAVELLFEVLDEMTQVQVPNSNEVIADVLADTLQEIVHTSAPVYDRQGNPVKSLATLMSDAFDRLSTQAQAAGVQADFDALTADLGDTLLATFTDDMNTADPADDVTRWKWHGLKRQLGDLLEAAANAIPVDQADRNRWAAEQQLHLEQLITGRDLVLGLDLLGAIANSPEKPTINKAISSMLTPQSNAQFDVFGGVLVLAAEALGEHAATAQLKSPLDEQALADVLHFFGRQLDPLEGKVEGIVELVRQFLRADDDLLLLNLARNALDKGANGTEVSALETLQSVFEDLDAASGPAGATTADSLEESLKQVRDFLNDQQEGLPSFILRIKNRPGRATTP